MSSAVAPSDWRARFRRHERALAIGWLAGAGLLVAVLVLPPTRVPVLRVVESVADRLAARPTIRGLRHADSLVAAERWDEAVAFLERFDREFPARNSRHVLHKQRERVLSQLALAYEHAGRTGSARRTWDRLVAFDSLNYWNHYLRGLALERMGGSWAVPEEARDAFAAALRVFPSHLGSLRGLISFYGDRGEFAPIVAAHRAWLDAYFEDEITLTLGDTALAVGVLMDGRPHVVEVDVPRPMAETLTVSALGYAFALDSVSVLPRAVAGVAGRLAPMPVALSGARPIGLAPAANGAWLPTAPDAAVRVPLPVQPAGAARLRLVVRLFKPVDAGMWAVVRKGYLNLLDPDGLMEAGARTVPFPSAAEADAAWERPGWARLGLEFKVAAP